MRIAVLGGGPGGHAAAFEAAKLGAEVVLVERDRLGGTCLNWGCIPTKTILRSARIVADTRHAAEFGLNAAVASVDVEALRQRKTAVVDELVAQLVGVAKRLKIEVVYGSGRLTAPDTIEVALDDGSTRTVVADAIVLATGSVPIRLPSIDHTLEGVWTSDEAVSLSDIPHEIVIIGGGVIGLEFACAYAAFGSRVVVVELMDQVLPGNDKRVVRLIQGELEKMGVEFCLSDAVEAVERSASGRMRSTLRSGRVLDSDVVLSAVGRAPNVEGHGYDEVGIERAGRALHVDEHFRTNVERVFAVGDLIGGYMLAHAAEAEGVAAARNAVALLSGAEPTETVNPEAIPLCVYTFPEVAVVGLGRDAAKERGITAVQAVAKFAANGKALGEGDASGFVQLVAEAGTGRIIGCQIVGPHAVEIIHEAALAIRHGLSAGELAHLVHAHPTVSEVIKFAALELAEKV